MAHFTKFKAAAMGQMFAHINRDRSTISKYGNADIDSSKTPQNFEFVQGDLVMLQKRLDEVAHSARSDLVVCVGVVITLPEELKEASNKKKTDFFKTCNDFLKQKFGAENCIYSVVHNDETTPHLHYGFVPVIEKEIKYRSKEKRGQTYKQKRICADDVITRKMLNTFHDELQNHISKSFPDVRIVSEEKEQRLKQNKSIAELKQEQINRLTEFTQKKAKKKRNFWGIESEKEVILDKNEYEELKAKTQDYLDLLSGKKVKELLEENAKLKEFSVAKDERMSNLREQNRKIQEQAQKAKKEAKETAEKEVQERLKTLEDENSRLHSLVSVAKTLINKLMGFADAYRKHASMDKRVDISQAYLQSVQNGFIDPDQYVNEKAKGTDIQITNTKGKGKGYSR